MSVDVLNGLRKFERTFMVAGLKEEADDMAGIFAAVSKLIDAAEYMLAPAYSGPDQDELRHALANVSGGESSSWQPIATAPKNRGSILGWSKLDGVLVYYPLHIGSTQSFVGWMAELDREGDASYPTHWMPIPAPPSEWKETA